MLSSATGCAAAEGTQSDLELLAENWGVPLPAEGHVEEKWDRRGGFDGAGDAVYVVVTEGSRDPFWTDDAAFHRLSPKNRSVVEGTVLATGARADGIAVPDLRCREPLQRGDDVAVLCRGAAPNRTLVFEHVT